MVFARINSYISIQHQTITNRHVFGTLWTGALHSGKICQMTTGITISAKDEALMKKDISHSRDSCL